ncbi:MAG: cryptochrome/photolyase family protein [Spirosomataceae bacterium]
MQEKVAIFWFRRDLRLEDNAGLFRALTSGLPVVPIFIFDSMILDKLEDKQDARVQFIHQQIEELHGKLVQMGSSLHVFHGNPTVVWSSIFEKWSVAEIYTNRDYEGYALQRDELVKEMANQKGIAFYTEKDQVIFEKNEILSGTNTPYTVFTPFSKKWKATLAQTPFSFYETEKHFSQFYKSTPTAVPSLAQIGFQPSSLVLPSKEIPVSIIEKYDETRDIPSIAGTTRLSVHLRFGTISIRKLVSIALKTNEKWLNELIWRDFYMYIAYHFPHIHDGKAFRKEYDAIEWRNDEKEFEKWCKGKTGFPIVDAGMRELNATGFMHNRVRMITASFLVKDLLIDWRWGEHYFAQKLLDFEFASNNGGWQWAAGSGCDAAPYFRVFNPTSQAQKFDPTYKYIKKWIPEWGTPYYPNPMVDHAKARDRVLAVYQAALKKEK